MNEMHMFPQCTKCIPAAAALTHVVMMRASSVA